MRHWMFPDGLRKWALVAPAAAPERQTISGSASSAARKAPPYVGGADDAISWPDGGAERRWMASERPMADFVATLKKVAAVLRDEGIPFALGGGLAAWARGGPETDHDVDFFLKPEDAERAQQALADAGLKPESPPEDWLHKVWDGDVLVDLIYRPSGGPVTDAWLERAEDRELMAMRLPILALEDLMTTKLLALKEQELDYAQLLKFARTLREQIDWDEVRVRTAESPFARAFFTLVEGLGIVEPATVASAQK